MKAILFILATLCLSCSSDGFTQNQPPTCDECVFEQTPKNVSWHLTVPADTARGQRIRISGTVFQSDGKTPAAGVLLYGYHTNAAGRYAKIGTEDRRSHAWWHGYLRGWLKTDANGRYEINTIKPAPYPGGTEPAHIHAMVKAPNQTESYWIHDFLFKGDPFLTDTYWYRSEMVSGNLRYEGITLKARSSGVQEGTRNIVLHPHYDRDGQNSGLLVGENCPAFDPTHVWGPDKGSRTC
ncbi:MAG: hypothetical protein LH606_16320, partial [Cytophagaceae bacterium]|nr:hypothetical protein [Cytophagaceae bacterium]